jgi:hypothetical protein
VPLGLPAGRNLDHLHELSVATDLEHGRLISELGPIDQRQRVQIEAVAPLRVLLEKRLPPGVHFGGRLLLDGQRVFDGAVVFDVTLGGNER